MEMSFINYVKASYFPGVLPAAKSAKSILLCFIPWVLYVMPMMICSYENFMFILIAAAVSVLCVGIQTTVRVKSQPSQFKLYPLSHSKHVIYGYFGDLLASLIQSILLLVDMAVYFLLIAVFTLLLVPVDDPGAQFINTYLGLYWNITGVPGGIFLVLYFFMGFGWAKLSPLIRGTAARLTADGIFYTLHAAVVVVVTVFSLPNSPEEALNMLSALQYFPYSAVFLSVYGIAAALLNLSYFIAAAKRV